MSLSTIPRSEIAQCFPDGRHREALSSEGAYASYNCKVIVYPINSPLTLSGDWAPLNDLAMGSFHAGDAQFVFADGGVTIWGAICRCPRINNFLR